MCKITIKLAILLLLIFSIESCYKEQTQQQAFAPEPIDAPAIQNYIHHFLQEPGMEGASLGLYVTDLEKDSSIIAYMPNVALATASTLKAVTTATAINLLGKDFRFETKLAYSGEISANGVLNGDVYLIGSGDPTFGQDNMPSLMDFLANRILEKGIKKINGKLIGDASIFDNDGSANTWIWEDIGNYYGVGPSGLTIHQNQYSIYFKTGLQQGDPTEIIDIIPRVDGLNVLNEVKTGKKRSGDNAYIYGGPYSYQKVVRGTLPPNHNKFMIKGAIPEPAKFCTSYFHNTLIAKNISIANSYEVNYEETSEPLNLTTLYSYKSAPLSEIVKNTNHKSINLNADALLKIIGAQKQGKGTFKNGIDALKNYWKDKGINTNALILHDGSGLSRYNAIPALTLTTILKFTLLQDSTNTFFNSLPVVGVSGTLKNMCKNQVAKGRISAKSGYIKNVRAYTGVINTYSDKKLVFSLLINNQTMNYRQTTHHIEELFNLFTRL